MLKSFFPWGASPLNNVGIVEILELLEITPLNDMSQVQTVFESSLRGGGSRPPAPPPFASAFGLVRR